MMVAIFQKVGDEVDWKLQKAEIHWVVCGARTNAMKLQGEFRSRL